jgi:pyoverdine/dityrosine biosynthesis protein Dit1
MEQEKYNNQKNDKIAKVQEEISQVKDVMIRNIDKVLERGEKIELLVDKTEVCRLAHSLIRITAHPDSAYSLIMTHPL